MTHSPQIYGNYKDSGIVWLGHVPSHWVELRIKDITKLERGKFTHRPRNDPQMYGGVYPFIQTGDVARAGKYITSYKQTLSDRGVKVSQKFNKGTLVMAIAANIGDVAILGFDSYFPDSIVSFKTKKHSISYLYYLLLATKAELDTVKVTSTQDNLNLERLNSLLKFVPPRGEQDLIADYLDKKTAQIDQKIELLKKKANKYNDLKLALIRETVTRGLDRNVKLKDSGYKWIGAIPNHWKTNRIKDLFKESKKLSITGEEVLLSVSEYSGITRKQDYLSESEFLTRAKSLVGYKICEKNDLVINIMLAWKRGLGITPYAGIVSPSYAVFHPAKNIFPKYFHYLLRNEDSIAEFKRYSTGIIDSRLRLYPNKFYSITVPVPPFHEQKTIANYLDEKISAIDKVIKNINLITDKLQELRKTLIYNVVTGKIKVVE